MSHQYFTIRIDVTGTAALDGVTPFTGTPATGEADPQTGVISYSVPGPVGVFDIAAIVGVFNTPLVIQGISIENTVIPHAPGARVDVQSPALVDNPSARKSTLALLFGQTNGIFPETNDVVPVDHRISIDTTPDGGAPGPHTIQFSIARSTDAFLNTLLGVNLPISSETVYVQNVVDFPDPSGGVIQGKDDTVYEIQGVVDCGSLQFRSGARSLLRGRTAAVDILLFSGAGAKIIVPASAEAFTLRNLQIQAPAGVAMDVQGPDVFTIDKCSIEALTIGTLVSGVGGIGIEGSVLTGFGQGLVFSGATNSRLTILNSAMIQTDGTGGNACVDFGSAVFDQIRLNLAELVPALNGFAISGVTNSGNLSAPAGNATVTDSPLFGVAGVGTALENITSDDARWRFLSAFPVLDSAIVGTFVQDAGTENTSVNNATKLVLTTTAITLRRFTAPVSNQLQYQLLGARTVLASFCFNAEHGTATGTMFDFGIAVNGTIVARVADVELFNRPQHVACTFELPTPLVLSDDVELFADRGGAGAETVMISGANLTLRQQGSG